MKRGRYRCSDKRIAALVAEKVAEGWDARSTGGGHLKLTAPTGKCIFTSSTPSDNRAWLNFRANVRRIEREVADQ